MLPGLPGRHLGAPPPQVYVSVKLRQGSGLGTNRPSVFTYTEPMAELKWREWREAIATAATATSTTDLVEQVAPPDTAVTELAIDPVHVSSPSVFWIQYGEGAEEKAERLQEILATCVTSLARVADAGTVARGQLYIAPFADVGEEEPCYYRARINGVQGDTAIVFFIDYGNLASVKVTELLVISPRLVEEHPDMVRIPGLALECCLAKVQPSRIRNSKGLWDQQAIARFRELLDAGADEGRLVGKVYSVTKSGSGHSKFVVALDNVRVRGQGGEEREVRATLIREGLAEKATESYISQQDHQARMDQHAYNTAMQRHLESYSKVDHLASGLRPKEEISKMNVKVSLTGPFSPLEHKVACVHRHGATKMVLVDAESVNAVMLDQSPGDTYDHYMVAASVGLNPNGENLQLRSTTWLPARPGFGALALMLFSPRVEMRTNANRTRITGCLTGLGPRSDWGKPEELVDSVERTEAFYPEHDVETRFDVNITNADVNTVNKIRYWMNQCLSKTDDGTPQLSQPKLLDKAQRGIKRHLEDLFSRERRLEDKEPLPAGRDYRWGAGSTLHSLPRWNLLEKRHRIGTVRTNEARKEFDIYKVRSS